MLASKSQLDQAYKFYNEIHYIFQIKTIKNKNKLDSNWER